MLTNNSNINKLDKKRLENMFCRPAVIITNVEVIGWKRTQCYSSCNRKQCNSHRSVAFILPGTCYFKMPLALHLFGVWLLNYLLYKYTTLFSRGFMTAAPPSPASAINHDPLWVSLSLWRLWEFTQQETLGQCDSCMASVVLWSWFSCQLLFHTCPVAAWALLDLHNSGVTVTYCTSWHICASNHLSTEQQ